MAWKKVSKGAWVMFKDWYNEASIQVKGCNEVISDVIAKELQKGLD